MVGLSATKMIVLFWIVITTPATLAVIEGDIDLYVVVPCVQNEFSKLKQGPSMIPNYFTVSEDQVRISIAIASGVNPILSPTMGNTTEYLDFLVRWNNTRCNGRLFDEAFDAVEDRISGQTRSPVVIALQTSPPTSPSDTRRKADKLRRRRAFVYAIIENSTEEARAVAENYTDSPNRVVAVPANQDFFLSAVTYIDRLENEIIKDLCRWFAACLHVNDSLTACRSDRRQLTNSAYFANASKCEAYMPAIPTCDGAKSCDDECDRRWPWEILADCETPTRVACHRFEKRRRSTYYRPDGMKHCAMILRCPQCPKTVDGQPAEAERSKMPPTYGIILLFLFVIAIIPTVAGIIVFTVRQLAAEAAVMLRDDIAVREKLSSSSNFEKETNPESKGSVKSLKTSSAPRSEDNTSETLKAMVAEAAVGADLSRLESKREGSSKKIQSLKK